MCVCVCLLRDLLAHLLLRCFERLGGTWVHGRLKNVRVVNKEKYVLKDVHFVGYAAYKII